MEEEGEGETGIATGIGQDAIFYSKRFCCLNQRLDSSN